MNLTDQLRGSYAPGVPYTIDVPDIRIHEILFETAKRYPNRAALDFLARQTTYKTLVAEVRQAATVLYHAGVRPGDRVAMVMPNCPQHVQAIFATSLLGAIVVEHNPLAPEEELKGEFKRHGARVVVAWENSVERLGFLAKDALIFGVNLASAMSPLSRTLVHLPIPSVRAKKKMLGAPTPSYVKDWDKAVRGADEWQSTPDTSPDDTALLIHTGGTTGVPKAVMLSHKNLVANANQDTAWVNNLHEGAEVFTAALPFFHAFGFGVSLLAGIRLGATIAVFPKPDPAQILLSQRRLPVTFFVGVPVIYDRLLDAAEEMDIDLSSIRYAISGAMSMDAELAARWEKATGGYMIEGYGMSEAAPIILGSPVSPLRRPSTLGIPFPSTEVRVVDPENPAKDLPDGETGELLARGPQVFAGYWNDPEETAHALKDGWLHTGDLVKIVDNFVVMADRRKELIISGGFNIYPTQVEDAVRSMPGVEDVAVVGMPGGSSGEEVVAALVLEAGSSLTLADVRTWAEKSLAHYALPRKIVIVSELPRSQIGKVLRKAVREQVAGFSLAAKDLVEHVANAYKESVDTPKSSDSPLGKSHPQPPHTTPDAHAPHSTPNPPTSNPQAPDKTTTKNSDSSE